MAGADVFLLEMLELLESAEFVSHFRKMREGDEALGWRVGCWFPAAGMQKEG